MAENDVKEAVELFDADWRADQDNREEAMDDLDALAGRNQWDEIDAQARRADGRPVHTINRLPQFVRQVVGDIRQAMPTIQVSPVGMGSDDDVAAIFNGLIRNIEQQSAHDQPRKTAIDNAVKCGLGHWRYSVVEEPDNPFSYEIVERPIVNPMAVVWDANARMVTRSDAGHCFIVEAVTRDAFKAKYPKANISEFSTAEPSLRNRWYFSDTLLVAEKFTVRKEKANFARLVDGSVINLDALRPEQSFDQDSMSIRDQFGNQAFIDEIREGLCQKVRWQKMTGEEILDEADWMGSHIPVVPVLGDQIHFERGVERISLIRWAKEPQRLYNYWRSIQSEVMGAAPKAPFIIGASQLGTFGKTWAQANRGNKPFLPYDDSKNSSIPARQMPPVASSGMQNEIMMAAEDMKSTTGIYDAGLGARGNETSGVAIRQRQMEGDVATNLFGDNLVASIAQAGRILVDLIPKVYDTQRMVRVLHEDGKSELIQVNNLTIERGMWKVQNDLTVGRYDIVAQTGANWSTRRQEALETLQAMIQSNPQIGVVFMDLIFELSDMPMKDALVERARKAMPPGMVESKEPPTPEQQAAMQQAQAREALQMMVEQAEAKKTMAEAEEAEADAMKARAGADNEHMAAIQKRLEIAAQTGQITEAVRALIEEALSMPPPTPMPTPPNNQLAPPQSGVF